MNRRWRRASGNEVRTLLAISIGLVGCMPNAAKCPHARFSKGFGSGDVQWNYDGTTGSMPLDQVTASTSPCEGSFTGGATWHAGDVHAPLAGALHVRCLTSQAHSFEVFVTLGDLATATGPHTAEVHYQYTLPGQPDARWCTADGTASVAVRNGVGGPAEIPALVTSDFVRTLDVHIDGAVPVTGTTKGQPCTPLSVDLTTVLNVTAPEVQSSPEAVCPNLG